jgi:AAA15 family ATPase/GTPase
VQISQGRSFTPVVCVKGANASGKTNLLKGLSFLVTFASRSFSNDPESDIPIDPFADSSEPTEFSVVFEKNGNLYEYELTLTESQILREVVYRTRSKKTKIVERNGNELTYKTKEFNRLSSMQLRRNATLVSTARQYEFSELKEVYGYFESCLSNVGYAGLRERPIDMSFVCDFFNDHDNIFQFAKKFIHGCDVGISDIQLIRDLDTSSNEKARYFPIFIHKLKDGREFPVTDVTESSGTKALFRNLGHYKAVLDAGGLLILDEFDINLHPHILPKLVNLFLDPEVNVENAQLIFTTHNAEIMDTLGRYRTYLVNKEDNESFAYRLDEVPGNMLRNDRPIAPIYNEGKIGGVPRI